MAPFSNFISFFFLTTLLLSLQIDARDSQFFSKITPVNNNNNNNNVKETELSNNEGPVNKPDQQQPVFIPETENNYGLYGHESGLHPPSTTTTTNEATTITTSYQPYKTEPENNRKFSNSNYYKKDDAYSTNQDVVFDTRLAGTSYSSSSNNNNNYYNNDKYAYDNKQNELSDAKYTEGGFNSMKNQNNNQKYYYNNNNNNNAATDRYFYNNNNNNGANDRYFYNDNGFANNKYYGERQGLSDTRFVEGGKFFYDVNSKKYNPTPYGGSARGENPQNWYNNRGYFGTNNNANSYENKNSMEGYQYPNQYQNQNQEVFEDEQEDFEP